MPGFFKWVSRVTTLTNEYFTSRVSFTDYMSPLFRASCFIGSFGGLGCIIYWLKNNLALLSLLDSGTLHYSEDTCALKSFNQIALETAALLCLLPVSFINITYQARCYFKSALESEGYNRLHLAIANKEVDIKLEDGGKLAICIKETGERLVFDLDHSQEGAIAAKKALDAIEAKNKEKIQEEEKRHQQLKKEKTERRQKFKEYRHQQAAIRAELQKAFEKDALTSDTLPEEKNTVEVNRRLRRAEIAKQKEQNRLNEEIAKILEQTRAENYAAGLRRREAETRTEARRREAKVEENRNFKM